MLLLWNVSSWPLHHHLLALHALLLLVLLHLINILLRMLLLLLGMHLLLLLHRRANHDAASRMAHHPNSSASHILLLLDTRAVQLLLLLRRWKTRRMSLGRRQPHRHSANWAGDGIVGAHHRHRLRRGHRARTERTVEWHGVIFRMLRKRSAHLLAHSAW